MNRVALVGAVVALLAGAGGAEPPAAAPGREHAWLRQLVGEWECQGEGVMEPGKPAVKCKGTETARALGGFWVHSDFNSEMMGMPVTGVMTLGFDAKKGKFVGTWVCSMDSHLCLYEGTLDAAGKVLTLDTEHPNPGTGKPTKMRDVVELKDKDTRVMTSHMQGEDGKWVQFMTLTARRKK